MAGGNGVSGDLLEQFKSTVQRRDAVGLRSLLRAVPALSAHVNDPIFDFNSRAVIQARQDPDVVEVLLEHGADLNLKSEWWAGGFGVLDETEPEAARFLIERGAVLDACSAAGLGLLDRLREIVAADSSRVNEWGGDGKRPLHFAATRAVVDFLVSRGADLEARDLDHGGTPAEWAVRERPEVCRRLLWLGAKGSIHLSVALNDRGTVRDLLARDPALVHAWTSGTAPGGHVHTYTGIGVPSQPLHVAARFDRPQLAAELLAVGADPHAPGQHGGTPLHWACWYGHAAVVELLLQHAPPLERPCVDFRAIPLHWAIHGSSFMRNPAGDYGRTVELLLDAGSPGAGTRRDSGSEAVQRVLRRPPPAG